MKYALYTYNTENIGDDIQSIAARRFIKKVDYRINRDTVGNWKNPGKDKVKLIANGWYCHKPYSWPISDKTVDPLYISMHVDQSNSSVTSVFLSDSSRSEYKRFGKIGARDPATKEFFENNNIESYLSGCVTLTLQKDKNIKKSNFILLTDVSDKVYKYVKNNTNKRVIYLTNSVSTTESAEVRDEIAEHYLYLYQSASCVITERLHTALPCLALGTPIVLIKKDNPIGGGSDRLRGLGDLAHHITESEFIDGKAFNINNPKENKSDYKEYRRDIIKKCEEFTGYNNNKSFSRIGIEKKSLEEVLDRLYYLSQVNMKKMSIEISISRAVMESLENNLKAKQDEINNLMGVKASAKRLTGNIIRKIKKAHK